MTCIFVTDDHATQWALEWLRQRGFTTVRKESCDWRRPRELQAIYGLARATLNKRLNHRHCPPHARDKQGRKETHHAMSPALHDWLAKPKRKGVAL